MLHTWHKHVNITDNSRATNIEVMSMPMHEAVADLEIGGGMGLGPRVGLTLTEIGDQRKS